MDVEKDPLTARQICIRPIADIYFRHLDIKVLNYLVDSEVQVLLGLNLVFIHFFFVFRFEASVIHRQEGS